MKSYTGRLESGKAVEITVEGTAIADVQPLNDEADLPYILPVLVDLQQNGALGTAFDDIRDHGAEGLRRIIQLLRSHGVGRILATLTTYPYEALQKSAQCIDAVLSEDPELDAMIAGFFHEGVFISPLDGWRGAHAKEWLLPPDYDRVQRLDEASGKRIKIVNVAPEEPGGLEFVERAAADGKLVAIGHANPTVAITEEAVKRGARMITHFGNGAPGFIHRHENPFWSFLDEPQLALGVICDGFHLPPDLVAVALRCKSRNQILPVSDASRQSGLAPGSYFRPNGAPMIISPEGRISIEGEENLLAGAWFQLDRGVEFLVKEVNMPFLEAWNQCSRIPAAFIGLELPKPEVGQEASFVLAHWHNGVVIDQAVHLGKAYLKKPIRPTLTADSAED